MKKILSLILVVVMALTLMTPAFTASAESVNSYSVSQSEVQSDDSSGGFFRAVVDFFRSLFFSRITFDTDGGSEIDDYYKLKFSRISSPADPTKEGYTFEGWEPDVPSRMPWSNLTVKAKWQAKEHNVYWVIDGETVKTESYDYGDSITAYVPDAKEGYSFSGWYFIPETMPDSDVTISGSYTKDTEIVVAESDEEFTNKVMELVNESLNDKNFDKEAALEDEFYMCRVVANCSDFSMIDFSMFDADTIVMNDDGMVVLQFANRDLAEECSDYLNGLSSVSFAEADVYVEAPEEVEIESIPSMSNSIWGEKYINADKYAYYLENNNFNDLITVAVIDTGIDTDHQYFNGRLTGGRNCFNGSSYPEDDTGHGTHVSGVVINCTNNLNVKVMPIKSLNAEGGTLNSIVSGINYAVSQRVQVINLSLESPYGRHSKYLEEAIENAVSKGIIVVVAAGNGEKITHTPVDTVNVSPANMDNAIVVGALDETGTKGSFSNYGDSVDVIAPGVDIPSTYLGGKYALMSGTSQAAPHIAAVAAMFKLAYPDYTPAQIETLIKQYCVDKGPSGRDDFYGEGCPDMYNAIPDCTVSFDTNGGTSVSSATTKNSSSVVLPTPSKSYKVTFNANGGSLSTSYITSKCSFDGWYTTSSLTGQKYSGGESYMLLDNQTMYAKWTNSTLGAVNDPTRSNYKFDGWYDSKSDGNKYTSNSAITDNITLYARWSQPYYISYNANGGSGAPATQYGFGSTTLSSTKPTRSGYKFLGWSTSSSATSASCNPGGKVSLDDGNLKLYAVWGKITVSITGNPATSGEQNMTCTNAYKVTKYTTYPGKVTSGTFYGYRFKLPSVSYQYIPSGSVCGWEIVSGNAVVNGDYMYISQPGTVKYRYRCGDYYSETLSYTLKLYKNTSAKNYIRKTASDSATSLGTIAANQKVYLNEMTYSGTYEGNTSAFGKVNVNGIVGWIICYGLYEIPNIVSSTPTFKTIS